jgi:two-component system sensor histidine kinase KdpD
MDSGYAFFMTMKTDSSSAVQPLRYIGAIGIVLASVLVAFLVHRLMPHASLSLLFLTGVLIVAAQSGVGPSLFASVLSFLAFNFFFTNPYYTLNVADEGDVATLLFFLIIAAITGNTAARMQREMAKRKRSIQRISALYEFSRHLSSAAGTEAVLEALAVHLMRSLDRPVCVYIVEPEGILRVRARAGEAREVPRESIEKAWACKSYEPVVIGQWTFLILVISGTPVGLVTLSGELDAEQTDLARSFSEQAGIAMDRTQLVADLEQARLVSETEQLRSALLSSVSHDLRTPLASIIGSTTSLLEYGGSFSDENRKELLATVVEEAQRLDRHIQNLLDMTRLGQGSLVLKRDWVDVHDIVSSAMNRMSDALKGLNIEIDISSSVPLLWVHGVLIEQAMVNLLDNAIRFSPDGGHITISAWLDEDNVVIELCDEGPGVPEEEREKIFDMFYTVRRGDRGNFQGTGLGLAICRGMVAAHSGTVIAHDGKNGRGTCMRITLPSIQPGELSKT